MVKENSSGRKQKVEGSLHSELDSDLWRLFLYDMKSPITRDKYQRRLAKFFEFAAVEGLTLQDKTLSFVHTTRNGPLLANRTKN